MTKLHLISHHLCPYVQRAVIVLLEKNIAHQRTFIDLADKPDWFLEMSPLGRVPVLETEGAVVFESQVIVEYLDEITPGSLHPIDLLEKARHRSWIEFGSQTLNAIGGFYNARDRVAFEQKRVVLRKNFELFEQEIAGPFFAGDTFHVIDGIWGTIFRYFDVFDQIEDFGIMAGLKKTNLLRQAVAQRPSVINAAPENYAKLLEHFLEKRNSYLSVLRHVIHQMV